MFPNRFSLLLKTKNLNFIKYRYINLRRRSNEPFKYVLLVIPVVSFGLGTWQVYRREWKLNLIKKLQERTSAEAIDFPSDLEDLKDLEYRRVFIPSGKYDYSRQVYLGPRSLVTPGKDDYSSGLITAGKENTIGLWVVTPFEFEKNGVRHRILVNRGWIPRHKKDSKEGQIQGNVPLTGIVRKTEPRPPLGAKNVVGSDEFRYRDIEAMSQALRTETVFLDADASSEVAGGPIAGQTRVNLRNEHFSYIITWYGLCIITAYLWYTKFGRRAGPKKINVF